jgi:hypothetical protein
MISIDKYEIINNEDGSQLFKIDYSNKTDNTLRLKIVMEDLLFRTTSYYIDYHDIYPNCGHWSTFNSFDNGHTTQFSMGVFIRFIDENNNTVHSQEIPFIITDTKRRSVNKYSHSHPNMWIIGDSNVGVMMMNRTLLVNNLVINWVSHLFLSINRFIKSDYKSFLKTIPIHDGDTLAFMLGEIDLRVSCGRNAGLKGISAEHNLDRILNKYNNVLKEIKELYPKCNITLMVPNPPIRDGVLAADSYLGIWGTEKDRMMLYKKFTDFFYNESLLGNINYMNCMDLYQDEEGFMKTELLNDNDSHVKNRDLFIESLSNKLNN